MSRSSECLVCKKKAEKFGPSEFGILKNLLQVFGRCMAIPEKQMKISVLSRCASFCENCIVNLEEWDYIDGEVTRLLGRAGQIEDTLSSQLVSSGVTNRPSLGVRKLPLTSVGVVKRVRKVVMDRFQPVVVLNRPKNSDGLVPAAGNFVDLSNEPKLYTCRACLRSFDSKEGRRRHVFLDHRVEPLLKAIQQPGRVVRKPKQQHPKVKARARQLRRGAAGTQTAGRSQTASAQNTSEVHPADLCTTEFELEADSVPISHEMNAATSNGHEASTVSDVEQPEVDGDSDKEEPISRGFASRTSVGIKSEQRAACTLAAAELVQATSTSDSKGIEFEPKIGSRSSHGIKLEQRTNASGTNDFR